MDPRIEVILNVMRSKTMSVEECSRQLGLSRSHFCRLFRREVGTAPGAYLREQRMQRALKLLAQSGRSICEIAFHLGFTDPSHFIRDFKRRYQMSPAAFRRSCP